MKKRLVNLTLTRDEAETVMLALDLAIRMWCVKGGDSVAKKFFSYRNTLAVKVMEKVNFELS